MCKFSPTMSPHYVVKPVASFEPTIGEGLTFPSSYSTTTSLRLLSHCYVMCDMQKMSVFNWWRYYFIIRKNIANCYRYRNG